MPVLQAVKRLWLGVPRAAFAALISPWVKLCRPYRPKRREMMGGDFVKEVVDVECDNLKRGRLSHPVGGEVVRLEDYRQGRMRYAPTGEVEFDGDGRDYAALSGGEKRVVV